MGLRRWVQRKICDLTWGVISHIDKDVIEEFADNMERQTESEMHKCACHDKRNVGQICHDKSNKQDHDCDCMHIEKLREVEQEWIDRRIIT